MNARHRNFPAIITTSNREQGCTCMNSFSKNDIIKKHFLDWIYATIITDRESWSSRCSTPTDSVEDSGELRDCSLIGPSTDSGSRLPCVSVGSCSLSIDFTASRVRPSRDDDGAGRVLTVLSNINLDDLSISSLWGRLVKENARFDRCWGKLSEPICWNVNNTALLTCTTKWTIPEPPSLS